ncbi:hypothetical protein Ahu01nite_050340 [Winogradskya humida]|uniref:Uncharacterized protein n=1 Tax=Winogradskya humida TaxID=113566 RepID=A0ABQ3ZTL1_9ACTN|nr:hypothetical protein Ahu01nite_050340 [Actinoplanes humidus]
MVRGGHCLRRAPGPWPGTARGKPAILDYHATEDRSWRLHFSAGLERIGAERVSRHSGGQCNQSNQGSQGSQGGPLLVG